MNLDFKKIVIDGKNMSVVSMDEFNRMYKNKSSDTDLAVEFNDD